MNTLTQDDYRRRLSEFVTKEEAKRPLGKRPQGFFGHWGFYTHCQVEFDGALAREDIEVLSPTGETTYEK